MIYMFNPVLSDSWLYGREKNKFKPVDIVWYDNIQSSEESLLPSVQS